MALSPESMLKHSFKSNDDSGMGQHYLRVSKEESHKTSLLAGFMSKTILRKIAYTTG